MYLFFAKRSELADLNFISVTICFWFRKQWILWSHAHMNVKMCLHF